MKHLLSTSSNRNIFLDVIPSRLSPKEFFKKMQKLPPFTTASLPTNPIIRKTILNQILHDWFHVSGPHYDIYDRLMDIIMEGYRLRHQKGSYRILQNTIEWSSGVNDPEYIPPRISKMPIEGFSFLGVSGMGKSLLVETILDTCLIQTHKHRWTTQVVYLKMNCTSIGSTKALCHLFFKSLDEVLGTNYFNKYLNSKYNAEKLIPVMANVAAHHRLGVLIIDEINHLVDAKGISKNQILNFLKNLNACIGLPIVYIGTPEAYPILRGNFQQARRTQGIGVPMWDRMKETDPEWERLITALWKNQVLLKSGSLTEGLKRTYYHLSQGILDPLIKLHVAAQKRALLLGLESIDSELLHTVSNDDFAFTNPIINALRTNDLDVLNAYRDVSIKPSLIGRRVADDLEDNDRQHLLRKFFAQEFSPEELKMCMEFIIERNPSIKPKQAIIETLSTLKKVETRNKVVRKMRGARTGVLLSVKRSDKTDAYTSLKKMGVIKSISEIINF